MKDTEKNEFEVSRRLYFAVRFIAVLLVLLLIYVVGRAAITFCLGLFADGDYLVQFPGQKSPIVVVQDHPEENQHIYVDPSQVVEIARAEITVAGDVMMHMPIVRTNKTAIISTRFSDTSSPIFPLLITRWPIWKPLFPALTERNTRELPISTALIRLPSV